MPIHDHAITTMQYAQVGDHISVFVPNEQSINIEIRLRSRKPEYVIVVTQSVDLFVVRIFDQIPYTIDLTDHINCAANVTQRMFVKVTLVYRIVLNSDVISSSIRF